MSPIRGIRRLRLVAVTLLTMVLFFPQAAGAAGASTTKKGHAKPAEISRDAFEREIKGLEKREAAIDEELGMIRQLQRKLEAQYDELDKRLQKTSAPGTYVYDGVLLTEDELEALSVVIYGMRCKKTGQACNNADYNQFYERMKSSGRDRKEVRIQTTIITMNRIRDEINRLGENIRELEKERRLNADLREELKKQVDSMAGATGSAYFTPIKFQQLAGVWYFGRSMRNGQPINEPLCEITLTLDPADYEKTKVESEYRDLDYKLKSCHSNESFWTLDEAGNIIFKNEKGKISTRFSRKGINHYEGEFLLYDNVVHYLKKK